MKEWKIQKDRFSRSVTHLKLGILYGACFFLLPLLVLLLFHSPQGVEGTGTAAVLHGAQQGVRQAQIMLLAIALSFVLVWLLDRSRLAEPWRRLGFVDGWLARLTAGWLWAYGATVLVDRVFHMPDSDGEGWALWTGIVLGWSLLSWGSHWWSLQAKAKKQAIQEGGI